MTQNAIDWDDAFDNSGYVPQAGDLLKLWQASAQTFRQSGGMHTALDQPYGAHAREAIDVFTPGTLCKGVVIFVHGGYWHLLDKSVFSGLAQGCLAEGWSVAMPSYPLAPAARISDITAAITRAVIWVAKTQTGPIVLAGHSAGGHLVSRMACTGVLPDTVAARLQRVVSISGVHDLVPLTKTSMNDTLNLTPDEALAESPARLNPLLEVPITFWVGASERPEFLRQNRLIAESWVAKGADVTEHYDPCQNHFTVISALADPHSPLTQELMR